MLARMLVSTRWFAAALAGGAAFGEASAAGAGRNIAAAQRTTTPARHATICRPPRGRLNFFTSVSFPFIAGGINDRKTATAQMKYTLINYRRKEPNLSQLIGQRRELPWRALS